MDPHFVYLYVVLRIQTQCLTYARQPLSHNPIHSMCCFLNGMG